MQRTTIVEVFLLIVAAHIAVTLWGEALSISASSSLALGSSSHARIVVGRAYGLVVEANFSLMESTARSLAVLEFVDEVGSAYSSQLALNGAALFGLIPEEEHALG